MNIKFLDFIKFIDNAKSIDELNIKCDLMYGENFKVILDKFCQFFGQKISDEFIITLNFKGLADFLIYIGKSFEERNKCYIQTNINFESTQYTRYTVEYCLPDCFKVENISINI